MADTLEALAYDEALRGIAAQAGVLDNLRARAGTLIAVASLVTSFLGGQALAKPSVADGTVVSQDLEGFGVIAIIAFVAVAITALTILWPYKWRFVMSPTMILNGGVTDYSQAQAELAGYHENNYEQNKIKLDRLLTCFQVGCGVLVIETVSWIVDLSR